MSIHDLSKLPHGPLGQETLLCVYDDGKLHILDGAHFTYCNKTPVFSFIYKKAGELPGQTCKVCTQAESVLLSSNGDETMIQISRMLEKATEIAAALKAAEPQDALEAYRLLAQAYAHPMRFLESNGVEIEPHEMVVAEDQLLEHLRQKAKSWNHLNDETLIRELNPTGPEGNTLVTFSISKWDLSWANEEEAEAYALASLYEKRAYNSESLALMPRQIAEMLEGLIDQRHDVKDVSEETLENMLSFYDPASTGPYSELSQAYQAAASI